MIQQKIARIANSFADKKVLIAFSGGIDSSVLAHIAYDKLKDDATAITVDSIFLPRREIENCELVSKEIGIKHVILPADLENKNDVLSNNKFRCYYCKKVIIEKLRDFASRNNYDMVVEGTNCSDLKDYRPGIKAVHENKDILHSPFITFGIYKDDIREIASYLNLSNRNKPSESCLATRIPFNTRITKKDLHKIEEAEDFLYQFDFVSVRVRLHNSIARIEISPNEFNKLLINRQSIIQYFHKIGLNHITLDIQGFRSGSMIETE
ncbi:ATP-dependent sacrificial sulfur transferase LarE [Methanosalsum natronophilum]|uniref:ATP-dependent sacrificial sulfur transferase LarE n=1 Tax=Methanosalsum natronophilum TaxID=768733 RepID=UPI0021693979|nr:ATP-dependent sacrificial sulfur transferase LarE [Methanosalsum natronophilum]MCS3923513.1 uncharacterized protein [Methanosalsum natronophilum]